VKCDGNELGAVLALRAKVRGTKRQDVQSLVRIWITSVRGEGRTRNGKQNRKWRPWNGRLDDGTCCRSSLDSIQNIEIRYRIYYDTHQSSSNWNADDMLALLSSSTVSCVCPNQIASKMHFSWTITWFTILEQDRLSNVFLFMFQLLYLIVEESRYP